MSDKSQKGDIGRGKFKKLADINHIMVSCLFASLPVFDVKFCTTLSFCVFLQLWFKYIDIKLEWNKA